MISVMKKYPIGPSRLRRSLSEGFEISDDGRLTAARGGRRILFLAKLDSNRKDCEFGRLRFVSELDGDATPIIRAFASNDPDTIIDGRPVSYDEYLLDRDIPPEKKLKTFENAGCVRILGKSDLLLYKLSGRFLWLSVEIVGEGGACLHSLEVFSPRDNFYNTFPEIYKGNGDFFHRYLSIFSSLFYDLQDTINALDTYVDVDTAPDEALPILASWMGLELYGGFLDNDRMRGLVKSAFGLIRRKGTHDALRGLIELFVEEPFYIIERRILMEELSGQYRKVAERLYGGSPYDVVVMINRPPDERLNAQLKYLIKQFVPARCMVKLVFLEQGSCVDSYCYMDINAYITGIREGCADEGAKLNGMTCLA